jgi:hypothetical protein
MRWGHSLVVVALLAWLGCEHIEPSNAESAPAGHVERLPPVAADPPPLEAPPPARKTTRPPRKLNNLKPRPPVEESASFDTESELENTKPRTRADESASFDTEQRSCCRYCSKGKACGNSCIAASKTCHQGLGCACDR